MEAGSMILQEALVLGLLLGVGSAFVVVLALAAVHWFYAAALPVAVAWALLPTKAYPAITYFLLTSGEILLLLTFARWWHGRRATDDPADPSSGRANRSSTFTLGSMLIAMGLIAALCGLCVIAVDRHDIALLFGSSIASSLTILVATWCTLSRRNKLLRLATLFLSLFAAMVIWDFTAWFDLYEVRSTPSLWEENFRFMLALACGTFAVLLAFCPAVLIKAFHNGPAAPVWHRRVARCIAFPLILTAVSLGGFFHYRLARTLPVPSTELPDPNGHDYFNRAGEPVGNLRIPDPAVDSPAVVSRFVADHHESLSLVREGLEMDCKTVLVWLEGEDYYGDELDAIHNARQLARVFRAESRVHAATGDFEQAAQSCVDCIRFAHEMSRGGLNVHFLVASAIEGVGTQEFQQILKQLDSSACRAATVRLLQVDADREPATDFAARDQLWSQVTFGWVGRMQLATSELFNRPQWYVSTFDSLEKRNDTIRRLLIAELALRAFTLEHESPPRQLSDLVPEYLPKLIQDPYDDAPLRYRSDETTATVYSIGPDLDDDNAQALTWDEVNADGDGDLVLTVLLESTR